ncbi:MAG: ABC transporter ATP-binding protein [Desulfobacteraceae bacterium]|nr:ABC transporter ATP-binding protein [Desulfobacteraceae bacterium]
MIIECKDVVKTYLSDGKTVKAADKVNLKVDRGDFVVILGHSGSGKTTLLSLIGGLSRPDGGTVLVNSVGNWQQSDNALSAMRNRTIGFIFQFASLIPTLTVLENVLLPLSFGSSPKGDGKKLAMDLLGLMGLTGRENDFPSQLSGGQQRRVAIARAFINQPEIILADEPTGDLDIDTEREILNVFKQYNGKGTTFLVVTHNRDLALSQNKARVLTMHQGVLTEETPCASAC